MSKSAVRASADTRPFLTSIQEFCDAAKKEVPAETKNQARLLIQGSRETPGLFDITPPSGGGVTGLPARKRGEQAIAGDLFGGRKVDLGGFQVTTNGLFIVSNVNPTDAAGGYLAEFQSQNNKPTFRKQQPGEEEIASLYTNKKGVVYGVEKQLFRPYASLQEMLDHVARYRSKSTGRISRAGLRDKVIGRHVFIDKMVISPAAAAQLLKHLYGEVGDLAAGWLPAAVKLGAKSIPAWIKRHLATAKRYADIQIVESGGSVAIEFWMDPKYAAAPGVRDLQRKVDSALALRGKALDRQTEHLIEKGARKASRD